MKIAVLSSTYADAGNDAVLLAKEISKHEWNCILITELASTEGNCKKKDVWCSRMDTKVYDGETKKTAEYGIDTEKFALDETLKTGKERAEKRMDILLEALEHMIETTRPDIVISISHHITDRLCNLVCRKKGVKMMFMNSTTPMGKTGTGKSPLWDDYIKESEFRAPSKEEEEEIDKYIKKTTSEKKLMNEEGINFTARKRLRRDIKDIFNFIFTDKRADMQAIARAAKNAILKRARKRMAKALYTKPRKGEKYVFFPLQIPHDASLTVLSPENHNQRRNARKIQENLPNGWKLYIKEHPKGEGEMPLKWLKEMARMKNTRLLNPRENTHDLIENCKVMIVATTLTGWEGILYGKPVITLGSPAYSKFGCTLGKEWTEKMEEASKKAPERERVKMLIRAAMESTHWCHIYVNDEEHENTRRLAELAISEAKKC